MPTGNLRDYEVVITLVAKDDTAKGARSSVSTIDRYALQAARAADQRALSAQNSTQRMVEQQSRAYQQLARDKERYAQQAAMAESRATQESARDTARYAAQAARDKERYAQQSSRDQIKFQQQADREQQRLYQQNVRAFERSERERVQAAQKANADIERQQSQRSQALMRTGRNIGVGGAVLTAAVTRPLVGFAEEAVSRYASYQAQVKGLEALYVQEGKVKDAGEATRAKLVELREVAKLPGLGFREAIEGQVRLQSVGFEAAKATEILRGFGRAVASTGGGKNELDRIIVQLAQMQSKGKVTMADLRPILEAAPSIGHAMKEAFGTIDTQELQKRGVTTTQFIDKLLNEFKRLPPLTGTLKNDLENLSDGWDVLLIAVGKAITDIPAVGEILSGAADAVNNLTTWIQSLDPAWQKAIVGTALFVAVLGPVLVVAGAVVAAIAAIGAEATLIAVAVAAAGVAIYAAWSSNLGGIQEKSAAVWVQVSTFIAEATKRIQTIVTGAGAFLVQFWANNGATIVSTAQRVWNAVYQVVAFLVGEIVEYTSGSFSIIGHWIQENLPLIQATFGTIVKIVAGYFNILLSLWKNYGGYLIEFASGIFDAIKASLQTFIKVFLGIFKLAMQLLQGDWSGAWETFKQIVYDAFWGLIAFLKGIGSALLASLKGAFAVLWGMGNWLYEKAKELGTFIVKGLWAGIQSLCGWLTSGFGHSFDQLIDEAKKKTESHSPSQVFFRIGRDMGLGIVLGLASMQAAAQEQMHRLVIPDKPETATGKGAAKINAARRKNDERDRPAYDLLENLYKDIDQLAPAGEKTRALIVAAELAKVKYQNTSQAVKDALIEAAKYYDQEKAGMDIESQLQDQLDATAKKLLELKYNAKEGASEVEKFDLHLAQLRASSPLVAEALDKHTELINKVRAGLNSVDVEEKARATKEAAESLTKAVANMADDATASLRNMATVGDTQLERMIDRLQNLKTLGLTLEQLDPLRAIVKSVRDLPEPERLKAIAEALRRIIQAAGVGTLGLTPTQQAALLRDASTALSSADTKDVTEAATRATSEYEKALQDLNGRLIETTDQSERAKIAHELETGALKDLSAEQKAILLQRASDVDLMKAQQAATQQVIDSIRQYAETGIGAISDSLAKLATGDVRGAWDTIRTGFRDLWHTIISDLINSGLHKALSGVLNDLLSGLGRPGTSTTTASGSGSGGGLSSIIQNFSQQLFGGNTTNQGSGISIPTDTSGPGSWTSWFQRASAAGAGPSGAPGGSGLSSLLSTSAASLPALAVLYGASTYASILSGHEVSTFQAITGGGLVGFLLNRNLRRRHEEERRTQLSGSVYDQTIQILNAARDGSLTESQAMAAFGKVESDYLQQVSTFKDKKTRQHATDWWYKDFKPYYEPLIRQGARDGAKKKQFEARFSATFASGGGTWTKMADGGLMHSSFLGLNSNTFHGRVPGAFDSKDDRYIRVTGNEVVLRPETWEPIEHHLIEHRVPGFPRHGFVHGGATWEEDGGSRPGGSSSGGKTVLRVQSIALTIFEAENKAEVTFEGLRDERNQEAVLEIVEKDIRIKREDGRVMRAIDDVKGQG